MSLRRTFQFVVILVAAISAASLFTGGVTPFDRAAVYLCLMLFPGMALYLFIERSPSTPDAILWAVLASPLIVGATGVLLILAGIPIEKGTLPLVLLAGVAGVIATLRLRGDPTDGSGPTVTPGHLAILLATVALFCTLTGSFPLGSEWWRYWSDAWFHTAVVSQIEAYGLPPEDPYFVGFTLQYMWFYHVLVLVLGTATHLHATWIMPLLNFHALTAFMLGAFLLSTTLTKRFLHGWLAAVFIVLAMNSLIWIFLPLKLVKLFIGEVGGWEELSRTYSFVPFNNTTTRGVLSILGSPSFLLNKFIVATAFSIALGFMSAFWYGIVRYLREPRISTLLVVFISILGMFVFHPLFGFLMVAALYGALGLLFLTRGAVEDFSLRQVLMLAFCALAGCVVVSPYLYAIMHLKQSDGGLPIDLGARKSISILVTCALVIVLALFQVRRLWNERSMGAHVFLYITAMVVVASNLIALPAYNAIDKPPYFVFFPLAVIGSWTIADRLSRPNATRRYRTWTAVIAVLLLVPVSAVSFLAYANTPTDPRFTDEEARMSAWVRENTSRDAVFIDSGDRVLLLVTGPRRYYYGSSAYAEQWAYPAADMAERRHVIHNLYSSDPIDRATFATLGSMDYDAYVIARENERPGIRNKFAAHPTVFKSVYNSPSLSLWKVDREGSREAADSK